MTNPALHWAARYWRFKSLSHDEARNLLCGLAPDPGNDLPPRVLTRIGDEPDAKYWERVHQMAATEYRRDEVCRVDADRYIEDWVRAGELDFLEPPNAGILEKIKRVLTAGEFEAVARMVEHYEICSKAVRYATDQLIRAARAHRALVPNCPLPPDQPGGITDDLKERRRVLVRRALKRKSQNQNQFCQENKITPDILRGVINSDSRRVDLATWTPTILSLLEIDETDWNAT
jgi:hypothetical protein